jgi:hypothetical protein
MLLPNLAALRIGADADGEEEEVPTILELYESGERQLRNHPEDADNRALVLAAVTFSGHELVFAALTFRHDREIVMAAVRSHWMGLRYASEYLQDDLQVVLASVEHAGQSLMYASERLKNLEEVVFTAAAQDGYALAAASRRLQGNRQLVLLALRAEISDFTTLGYADLDLCDDAEIVARAVARHGEALRYASEALQDDAQIVMIAVQQNGNALEWASERLKNTLSIVQAALVAPREEDEEELSPLRFASAGMRDYFYQNPEAAPQQQQPE